MYIKSTKLNFNIIMHFGVIF